MGGIIPNKEEGITPGVLWAVSDPANTTYDLGDTQTFGGLSERLGFRTQDNVIAVLKDSVKSMAEWQDSTASVWGGMRRGTPGNPVPLPLAIIEQLVSSLTGLPVGTWDTVNEALGEIANLPVIGDLINIFLSFLSGGGVASGDLSDLQSLLGNIPLLGPLIEALTGGNVTGAGGLAGLASFFDFGSASSLTSFLSDITGAVGPLIDRLISFLTGGTVTSGSLDDLTPLLDNIPLLGPLIEALTGGNFTGADGLAGLASFFDIGSGVTSLSGFINTVSQLVQPLIDLFISFLSGGSLSSGNLTDLQGLLDNIPLLGPLLSALTGGNVTGADGLAGLASFFDIGSGVTSLSGFINTVSQLVQPLIDLFISFLSGGSLSSGNLTDLQGLLDNIPLLGPLLSALTGGNVTGVDGLAGLASFFDIGSGVTSLSGFISTITALVQPLIDMLINFLSAGTLTSGDLTDLQGLLPNFALIGDLLGALTGSSGGGLSVLTDVLTNLTSMLGGPNLLSSPFDPISAGERLIEEVLSPAGVLTNLTQIPPNLFGFLAPNNTTNVLRDGGFDDARAVDGLTSWFWDGTTGHTATPLGSLRTVGSSALKQFRGVAIGGDASTDVTVGVWTKWSSLAYTAGTVIALCVDAYDASDTLITPNTSRVVANIDNPTTNSSTYPGKTGDPSSGIEPIPAHDAGGWVYLSGSIQPPAGTSYTRITFEVCSCVSAGTVWFDDASMMPKGMVGAGLLTDIANIPQLFGTSIQGFSGILDLLETWSHMVDGLSSAYNLTDITGANFTDLFALAQQTAENASNSMFNLTNILGILGIRTNRPTHESLDPTGEASLPIASATDAITIPPGSSVINYQRALFSSKKGFIEFYGYGGDAAGGTDSTTLGNTGPGAASTAATSVSENFTPLTANARLLIFVVFSNTVANSGVSATVDGTAATQKGSTLLAGTSGSTRYYMAAFEFTVTSTAQKSVVVTTAVTSFIKMNVQGYGNVASTGTLVTNSGTGTALASGTVASATGRRVVNFMFGAGASFSARSGTQRWYDVALAWTIPAQIQDTAGTASTSLTATQNTSAIWGSLSFEVVGVGSAPGVYMNASKVDTTTGVKTKLWGSDNLQSQVPTGATPIYVRALIPNNLQPQINASDLIQHEIVNNTGSNLVAYGRATGKNNHPTVLYPANFGATRSLAATGGASPASMPDSAVTYSGTFPHINFGLLNVPPNYHAPVTKPYGTGGATSGAKTTNVVIATEFPWLVSGDLIDAVALGAGGGGSGAAYGNATGFTPGGDGGSWTGQRLVYGVDVKIGSTIVVVNGRQGASAGGWSMPGGDGAASTITYTKPDNSTATITAAGGAGGPAQYLADNTGFGPGNFTFQGIPYYGGGNVGGNTQGAFPGGGGGGGVCCWSTGVPGNNGECFLRASQQAA